MQQKYFNVPIRTRYNENIIIVDYDNSYHRTQISTLNSNMLYACFREVCKIHGVGDGYNPICSCSFYSREYKEQVTEEVYNEFSDAFFTDLDKKFEKMLELVLETMNQPIAKFFGSCDGRRFDVLKYFAEFEKIPDIKMFYVYGIFEYDNFITSEYRNIENTERYFLIDYSVSKLKKHTKLKNKYVLKSKDKTIRRFINMDIAYDYLKTHLNFIKLSYSN
jgi:hypothetical protein